jgi:hypothetical protein
VLKGMKVQERRQKAKVILTRIKRENSGGKPNTKKPNTVSDDTMFRFESENHKAEEMVQR